MPRPEGTRLRDVPAPALALALAALAPFPAAAAAMWFLEGGWAAYVFLATLNYGLAALAFLGAVHAGLGLAAARQGSPRARGWWLWSFAPGLAGLVALLGLVDYPGVLLAFLVAFLASHMADLRAVEEGAAPGWYAPLRRISTAVVILSLGALLLHVNASLLLAPAPPS